MQLSPPLDGGSVIWGGCTRCSLLRLLLSSACWTVGQAYGSPILAFMTTHAVCWV